MVADATNDTLTLAAGTNAVLTTDATTDEVTIGVNSSPTFTNIVTTGSIASVGNIGSITGSISGVAGSFTGDATFGGDATISGNLYTTNLNFIGGGSSTIGPSTVAGSSPSDLEIKSNGNVTIHLDDDSDEPAQKFEIVDGANATVFSIDENGQTAGLLTTPTPTLTFDSTSFVQSQTVTMTVTNYVDGATVVANLFNASNVNQNATFTDTGNGVFEVTAPTTVATGYYATATMALAELKLFSGTNQSGTEYPTNAMTSNSGPSPYTVTGREYSSSYPKWKLFDKNDSTWFWNLGATTSNNWIVFDNGSHVTTLSGSLRYYTSFNDSVRVDIEGSTTGNFSGEETLLFTVTQPSGSGYQTATF